MSKYRNVRADGFASKKEAKRYGELALLERAGHIRELRTQVKFEVIPKWGAERAADYIADFTYWEGLALVVEDVKSEVTRKLPAYVLKRKLMNWRHGIVVKEI